MHQTGISTNPRMLSGCLSCSKISTMIAFQKLHPVFRKPIRPISQFGGRVDVNSATIPARLKSPIRGYRRNLMSPPAGTMFSDNLVVSDIIATGVTCGVAFSLLKLWKETAERGLEQKLNRKLVHISIGLAFMLCWPLFSAGTQGSLFAALMPGINIVRMLLVGSGIVKDEGTVKSMSRFGDRRELLRGPLYYATAITLASVIYWRSSPISIAAICNLCAGDGLADIVGRRFGSKKLPYNKDKSLAGSIAMALAGFLASIGYMYYFSSFGFIQENWKLVFGFLIVSFSTAVVESLPISSRLDDNLTVPLTSILVGSIVL